MIYFDEAGNSGGNLLDAAQPTFLLLSHNYNEEEAKQILNPLLAINQAKELHFARLKKYEKSRKGILDCIGHPLIEKERIFHYVAHKEFMVVIQMVDQLIEQVLYSRGIDIYKGGLNLSTANIMYIMGNNVWNKTLFSQMGVAFVNWMRSKQENDKDVFYASVEQLYRSIKHRKDKQLVGLIRASRPFANNIMESVSKYSLDATLSCFNVHCHHWAKIYNEPFDLVLDKSKQIEYWEEMIKFMTKSLPKQEVGFGSRKYTYPLLIKSLSMADSEQNISIQLADILASSLNYCYGRMATNEMDDFSTSIYNGILPESSHNSMWPTTAVTPESLDMTDESGTNPLDFIADVAMQQWEEYKKTEKK
jgi:hypothetical protein